MSRAPARKPRAARSRKAAPAFSIAEAVVLLSLEAAEEGPGLSAWMDLDYALAGAHLMDLSFQGLIDYDLSTAYRTAPWAGGDALAPVGWKALERLGGRVLLRRLIDEVVTRIGDLRAAVLGALAARQVIRTSTRKIAWGFVQTEVTDRAPQEAQRIRQGLRSFLDSDELPGPEEAALLSLLHASGLMAPVLGEGRPHPAPAARAARLEAIRKLDIAGQAVGQVITDMRRLLHAYLLDEGGGKARRGKAMLKSPTVWEWRAFWPVDSLVEIPPALGRFDPRRQMPVEVNDDLYLFVEGKKDNIKFRGSGLKVKPVTEAHGEFTAFGPTVKAGFPEKAAVLAAIFPRFNEVLGKLRSGEELLAALAAAGYRPEVVPTAKNRRDYRAHFGIRVEFAQISVAGRLYCSIGLESRYLTALRILARSIPVGGGFIGGYSDFLARIERG